MSSQASLKSLWDSPPALYRSAPFWSWNAELSPQRVSRQFEDFVAHGMGGAFMHVRYGLKTPYLSEEFFECIQACIDTARRLDAKAYLYDEDRWPSGSAGGFVTREHPEFRQKWLAVSNESTPPEGAERLLLFAVRRDAQNRLLDYEEIDRPEQAGDRELMAFDLHIAPDTGWMNGGAYLDVLNPDAVAEFIRLTHQAYADRFGETLPETSPAIFTDEPQYARSSDRRGPTLPWTQGFREILQQRCGYDVAARLPEVVCPTAGEVFSRTRLDFMRTLCARFVDAFSRQIGRWCEEHGLALTGHMNAEETLLSQADNIGTAMRHYEHMQWPGIDLLTEHRDELSTMKQCSSVADQLGKQRCLSELYGCTGWDWPLEGHKFIGDWHAACGINFRCPHLSHYSLEGGAKRDYPASICAHSPWWPYYHTVEDYFARINAALTRGRPVRDVLVIHPIESAWGLWAHTGDTTGSTPVGALEEGFKTVMSTLTSHHHDWDFGDEDLLARHGRVENGEIIVGQMRYRAVVVPPSVTLRAGTQKLLEDMHKGGGKVLFVGAVPTLLDGEESIAPAELAKQCPSCPAGEDALAAAMDDLLPRRLAIREGGQEQTCIYAMLRDVDDGQLLFVQSRDRSAGHAVEVDVEGSGPVVLWDARSGERQHLNATQADGRVSFRLSLPPTGSALVSMGMDLPDVKEPQAKPAVVETVELAGPFDIERTEPNTLPLDYCQWRRGDDGEWSQPMHSLMADIEIRESFGLKDRLGREHQPWYLYTTGAVDTSARGLHEVRRVFHVSDVPAQCALAIERPGDFDIRVNGTQVSNATGWWVDPDIHTIDITHALQPGENELLLRFDYRPDMETEDVYLVGDFGTARRDSTPGPNRPDDVTLTAPPQRLEVGPWTRQGLDFFTGSVRYRLDVHRPANGKRLRVRLPGVQCTAAVIHAGGETFVLPWPPFEADITNALAEGSNEVWVEVIGGRKNTLGPLHTPWEQWTGPGEFNPRNPKWTEEYLLTNHGLTAPVLLETLE